MRTFRLAAAALALCLTTALHAETLRIGVLPAADSIVLEAAVDEGLFKKEGLDVVTVPLGARLKSEPRCARGSWRGTSGTS